eukprot:6403259-Amphidinium_carterae.1
MRDMTKSGTSTHALNLPSTQQQKVLNCSNGEQSENGQLHTIPIRCFSTPWPLEQICCNKCSTVCCRWHRMTGWGLIP